MSAGFARRQALGLMAWKQIDVQLRIRMQSARGSRKAAMLRFKVSVETKTWSPHTTRMAS